MKVLIVDDNKENIYLLKTLLAGKKYEVVSAYNGAEAMAKLEQDNFQLIISDILMPEVDGFQFCRQVKESERFSKIPFIFYSATYIDEKDEVFALQLGANKFIRKPLQPDEFIKTIKSIIKDAQKGKLKFKKPSLKKEEEIFKLYNERLVQKLEKKMVDLEAEVEKHKQTENKLRQSEERFRGLFENAVVGLYRTTPDGKITVANHTLIKMLGYSSFEELAKRNLKTNGFESEYPRAEFEKMIKQHGQAVGFESAWLKKDRSTIYISESARALRDNKGKIIAYEGTVQDITNKKQAEMALIASEQKFREMTERSFDIIAILDSKGFFTYVSPSVTNVLGYLPEEMVGKHFRKFVAKIELDKSIKTLAQLLQGKKITRLEYEIQKKDKSIAIVEINSGPIRNGKKITGVQLNIRDITARVTAEKALRVSEEFNRRIIESSNDCIKVLDLQGNLLFMSNGGQKLLEIQDITPYLNKSWLDLWKGKFRITAEQALSDAIKKGSSYFRAYLPTITGKDKWWSVLISQIPEVSGKVNKLLAISRDITPEMAAEEKLRDSLLEKEVLLKEIHHRVKNNMNVLISLLHLQCQHVDDLKGILAIQMCIKRIYSMALIHEKLYKSENFANVNFRDYTITLIQELIRSYQVENYISTKIDVEEISLNIETAVPLGLIINELITNAIKHGFPDKRDGEIGISLTREKNNDYELSVHDNGVGLPAKIDVKSVSSLGLKLVDILSSQINGKLNIKKGKGTTISIKFKGYLK